MHITGGCIHGHDVGNDSLAVHHDTRFFILQGASTSARQEYVCDSIRVQLTASL